MNFLAKIPELIFERILTELRSEKFEWFDHSPIEPFNLGSGPGQQRSVVAGFARPPLASGVRLAGVEIVRPVRVRSGIQKSPVPKSSVSRRGYELNLRCLSVQTTTPRGRVSIVNLPALHCVDLGESFQTHIYLQNFASGQPRTSPIKPS